MRASHAPIPSRKNDLAYSHPLGEWRTQRSHFTRSISCLRTYWIWWPAFISEGEIRGNFAKVEVLDVDTKGDFFPKGILLWYGLQLAAEVAAIKERSVDIDHILKQGQLQPAHIQESAGRGIVLPGLCVSAY